MMTGGTTILGNHHMVFEPKSKHIKTVFLPTQVGLRAIKLGFTSRNGGLISRQGW
jgi:hypothetical protein